MREILVKLIFIVLGLCAGLLLGEAALRFASHYSPYIYGLVNIKTDALKASDLRQFTELSGLKPYRDWRGYYNNAWGLNDREFTSGGSALNSSRILALGDSQTYSSAGYPQNSFTLAEQDLRRSCRGNIEILNAGIPGAGVLEYKKFFELAAPILKPKIVLIGFYMGNDAPDNYHGRSRLYPPRDGIQKSFMYNFITNGVRYLRGFEGASVETPVHDGLQSGVKAGGRRTGSPVPVFDSKPPYAGPSFSDEGWDKVTRNEMYSLYTADPAKINRGWNETIEALDQLRESIVSAGAMPAMVFFPSEFQVYPASREEGFERLKRQPGRESIKRESFSAELPVRRLSDYCERSGMPCFDLTPDLARAARGSSSPLFVKRDTHLNLRGNRIAAASITRFLAGIEGCATSKSKR